MPSLQRYRYEDILADLNRVDCWLAQLGLAAKQDRIHFVIEVLRQVEAEYQRVQRGEPADEAADVRDRMFAICEALEFRDIYRAFRYEPPERIIRVLERALSGPHRPADENQRNADGRNIGFELALGADLRLRGVTVHLEEPRPGAVR